MAPTTTTTTSPQHAPTGAPIPSPTAHAETSQFASADPILPPTPQQPPTSTSSSATSSSPSTSSSTTSTQLPSPASANLRPLFLTLLLACPLLAALPPRKLDLYTFSLAGAWVLSLEEVGRGQRFGWQQSLSRRREEEGYGGDEGKGENEGGVKRLWMGKEREGWKERRLREEREGLARGKGYSDLIGEAVEGAFREGTGRGSGEGEG